jgi:hypothetical protein
MSEPRDDPIGPLIRELDEASRTLSKMHPLTPPQAARIAARIDRLTSQLAKVSPPVRAGLFGERSR